MGFANTASEVTVDSSAVFEDRAKITAMFSRRSAQRRMRSQREADSGIRVER
jgi:hypothetical protein